MWIRQPCPARDKRSGDKEIYFKDQEKRTCDFGLSAKRSVRNQENKS